jgi:hypothetical protein
VYTTGLVASNNTTLLSYSSEVRSQKRNSLLKNKSVTRVPSGAVEKNPFYLFYLSTASVFLACCSFFRLQTAMEDRAPHTVLLRLSISHPLFSI